MLRGVRAINYTVIKSKYKYFPTDIIYLDNVETMVTNVFRCILFLFSRRHHF